jgi:hypothetical protein
MARRPVALTMCRSPVPRTSCAASLPVLCAAAERSERAFWPTIESVAASRNQAVFCVTDRDASIRNERDDEAEPRTEPADVRFVRQRGTTAPNNVIATAMRLASGLSPI